MLSFQQARTDAGVGIGRELSMGNPSTYGCGPDQSPMALPKKSSRHRQSRSISSLPLENLGSTNCNMRSSMSAHSSPARPPLITELHKPQSIANILGHASPAAAKPKQSRPITELATAEPDRKPSSFNPFRGTSGTLGTSGTSGASGSSGASGVSVHRRVGSGSSIGSKASTWDYSPRARFGGASLSTCNSAAGSPKKLDKYAVAKIAASLFHAPSKLERSLSLKLSLSRSSSASHASHAEKKRNNHGLKVGEVILPQNHGEVVRTEQQSAEGGGVKASSWNGPLEESAISQAPQNLVINTTKSTEVAGAPSVQDPPPVTKDTAEILNEESCRSSPEAMWSSSSASPTASIAALVEEEPSLLNNRNPSLPAVCHVAMEVQDLENLTNIQQPNLIATDKVNTEEELTEAALRCSIASDRSSIPVTKEGEEGSSHELRGRRRLRMMRASSASPVLTHAEVDPSGGKTKTMRKRRRSMSASGMGAMLLRVVQVPESGVIVTKRLAESWGGEERAWRDWPEHTAAPEDAAWRTDARDGSDGSVVSDSAEREDAVKAIYSKFVNIEIDPRHQCVELEQHLKDIAQDDNMDSEDWDGQDQQEQRASSEKMPGSSSKHLPPVKVNSRSVHDGKARARKTKTIRRGRLKFYNEDGLKEYLKVTDSFAALAQADTTTDTPAAKAAAAEAATTATAAAEEAIAAPLPPLPPTMGQNRSIRERSLTFVSRLQAPSTATSSYVDAYQPCSVSILSNPSFSSSYQDKLWEEQAEFYSKRGTPGRIFKALQDDDAPPSSLLYKLQRSPQPDFGSAHLGYNNNVVVGRSGLNGMRSPSESGHFMQQIMSRIRGSSLKSERAATTRRSTSAGSCPKTQMDISKRRNPWSSCMCFSVKS